MSDLSLRARVVRGFGHLANRTLLIFVAIALMSVASTLLAYWMDLRVARANHVAQRTENVIAGLEDRLATLKDVETGQRGFILTGDEKYLEPYDAAIRHIGVQLDQLQDWGRRGLVVSGEVTAVARLTREKLDRVSQTIETRRQKGLEGLLREPFCRRLGHAVAC